MSPVETLREAARLIRERAEAATPSPWTWAVTEDNRWAVVVAEGRDGVIVQGSDDDDVDHIASWHPAVALAVADWLEADAGRAELLFINPKPQALAVARAYLAGAS